jgi:hypothetical protein
VLLQSDRVIGQSCRVTFEKDHDVVLKVSHDEMENLLIVE